LEQPLEKQMRKFIVGAAAAALVASGTVAQAAPVARTAAPVEDSEGMFGTPALLGILGAIVLGLIVWQINEDNDDDLPTSP
jgi:ammonia channel protein AmtB